MVFLIGPLRGPVSDSGPQIPDEDTKGNLNIEQSKQDTGKEIEKNNSEKVNKKLKNLGGLPEDDDWDSYLNKLLTEIDKPVQNPVKNVTTTTKSTDVDNDQKTVTAHRKYSEELLKKSQFPSEMSCTTAFDELFMCYSLGGVLTNIYRFGNISDCSDKVKKFKFCIKTLIQDENSRKENIRNFYVNMWANKLSKGSSEDIWTARKQLVKGPFQEGWATHIPDTGVTNPDQIIGSVDKSNADFQ